MCMQPSRSGSSRMPVMRMPDSEVSLPGSVSTGIGACMAAGVYEVGRPARLSSAETVTLEAQWQDFGARWPCCTAQLYMWQLPEQRDHLETDATFRRHGSCCMHRSETCGW